MVISKTNIPYINEKNYIRLNLKQRSNRINLIVALMQKYSKVSTRSKRLIRNNLTHCVRPEEICLMTDEEIELLESILGDGEEEIGE